MSFTLVIRDVLQYAYNIFSSALPMVYLFVGGSFAAFVLGKIINIIR